MIGYLDIETSFQAEVTVVGLMRSDLGLVQLVGEGVTREGIADLFRGLDTVCTFNGESFDLPVLRRKFGIGLIERMHSVDLSIECRRVGRRGGLKRIEMGLSIPRGSRGISGYDAMLLWERWERGERAALDILLDYNRDDVINLRLLERRLRGDLELPRSTQTHVVSGVNPLGLGAT